MLEIVAESLNDGWALVRDGDDRLVLVRPPYSSSNLMASSEDMIERMIREHGFQAVSKRFAGWSDLIASLRAELNRVRESLLGAMPAADMMRELLADAPEGVFDDYLHRIESELIPARRWTVALQLLSIMNATEAVGRSAGLRERVSTLISTCSLVSSTPQSENFLLRQRLRCAGELMQDVLNGGIGFVVSDLHLTSGLVGGLRLAIEETARQRSTHAFVEQDKH